MQTVVSLLLLIVGVINILPLIGVFSSKKLSSAYDVKLENTNLVILLKHRALLFGLIGGFVFYSVFKPAYQIEAMIMAAISMGGFIIIAKNESDYSKSLSKIVVIDIIGIASLIAASIFKLVNFANL